MPNVRYVVPDTFSAGDILVARSDAEVITSDSLKKTKEFIVDRPGTLRVYFEIKSTAGTTAAGQVYRNGNPVGTRQTTTGTAYVPFTEDIAGWSKGDHFEFHSGRQTGNVADCYARFLKLKSGLASELVELSV